MSSIAKEAETIDAPVLPHFYFLLQAVIQHGPLALLEFTNADLLYILKNAKIPVTIDKALSPEISLFSETWNLVLEFWASFIGEKNRGENLQKLARDIVILLVYLNIDLFAKKEPKAQMFSVYTPTNLDIHLSGQRKKSPVKASAYPSRSSALKYQMPNLVKVSTAITKLTPAFISLFTLFIKEKALFSVPSEPVEEPQVVHWPSESQESASQQPAIFDLSKQVESMIEEAQGFISSSPTAIPTKLKPLEQPSQEPYLLNQEPFIRLKVALNELDYDTRKEFDGFLRLMEILLQALVAPVPILIDKIPREFLNPMISFIGLLDDIGGEQYSKLSATIVNWLISCIGYLLEEPRLSDSSWLYKGNDLIAEGQSLSVDVVSFFSDSWLQGWFKRFIDHFKHCQETISTRMPPIPPSVTTWEITNLFSFTVGIRDWASYLFFKLPKYISSFSWQVPTILFPYWFKKALKNPIPRIEFKYKNVSGWIDEIGSIKGKWHINIQSLSRVYPKKDPHSLLPIEGPWTPGLKSIKKSPSSAEPIARWYIQLNASKFALSNARYFYRFKSRWLALGFKKKSLVDVGRVDIEMGKWGKTLKLPRDMGISIKMELGVPGIIGAPIIAQPSSPTGFSVRGILVQVKDLNIRFKSDRHPNIYPVILPFANSIIKKRISTMIEDEVIRWVNG